MILTKFTDTRKKIYHNIETHHFKNSKKKKARKMMNIFNVILLTIMLEFKARTHEILETQKTIYETHCSPKKKKLLHFASFVPSFPGNQTKPNPLFKLPKKEQKERDFQRYLILVGGCGCCCWRDKYLGETLIEELI